jgi:hypothetical protein
MCSRGACLTKQVRHELQHIVCYQRRFIIADPQTITLRRSRLAENRTGTAFGEQQSRAHVLNAHSLREVTGAFLNRFKLHQTARLVDLIPPPR